MPSAIDVIKIARTQVGVHEGRSSSGAWNNDQRYSDEVPGFDWSDGQPWCDTFVAWCAWKAGFTEAEWPRSASCDASGSAFKKQGRWSEYPAVGAQVLFGVPSDLQHTGIVTKYDSTFIWTVEGNTNASGSYQGDGVYTKMHERRNSRVIGYGYPHFTHPIDSADPKWQKAGSAPRKGLWVHGVDISHWQTQAIDYTAAMKAGVRFAYLKSTEDDDYRDPTYAKRRAEIAAARHPNPLVRILRRRLYSGAYHFARPQAGDAAGEARYFLSTSKPKPGDMLPMLDLEDMGHLSRAQLTTWVGTFVGEIRKALGVRPIIYTRFDLDETFGCLLWVARYSNVNAEPEIPAPWKRWDVRQFSNGQFGIPNSVAGFGHVDLNTLRSGLKVSALRIPQATKPEPKPDPKPEPKPPAKPPKPRPQVEYVDAFTASRFDRSPASLEVELDDLMSRCGWIAGTEVDSEPRGRKLREKAWAHYRGTESGQRDECFQAWPVALWEVPHSGVAQVTDLTYFTEAGVPTSPVQVNWTVAVNKVTGFIKLQTVGHYPSFVQGTTDGFWSTAPLRVAALKDAVRGTRELVERLETEYRPHGTAITGDWNLDIGNPAIWSWFGEQLPGYTPNWPKNYDGRGDLGKRNIVIAFHRGIRPLTTPRVEMTESSDHKTVIQRLVSP